LTASEHSGEHVRLPPMGARTWYDVLDVARDASDTEIEAAYDRAIALIEGDSVGGYMVLDPDAKASAKSDVETAFLVLSDPNMRAAFDAAIGEDDNKASRDEALAAAQLLDEEEWIASGPPSPGSTPPREASGPTRVADAANDDREAATGAPTVEASEAATAPPSTNPPGGGGGGGLRFLSPVFDDTSGPVPASEGEDAGDDDDLPAEAGPGPALTVAAPAGPSGLSKAPPPRLTREEPLDPDMVPTAPPTAQPVVSHIKTLPPELEHVLVEGAEVNGQVIRRLRESRQLTVDEVAAATHIRKAYLEAIENMDVNELPARVYLRGFLTQIARVLKVDKKALSDGYLSFIERFQK
jgi:hypothetical protein